MNSVKQAAAELIRVLEAKKMTVSSAEASSGGAFSQAMTAVPGSSAVFSAGVAAYSDRAKQQLLGVPKDLFRKNGAVSEEAAAVLAYMIRRKTKSSLGVAITGIEGPSGGSEKKPVGTVYIAVAGKKRIAVQKLELSSEGEDARAAIREQSVLAAMKLCRRFATADKVTQREMAVSLRRYRKYLNTDPVTAVLRYFLPWPGDHISDIFFKLLLIAAIAAGVWAAGKLTETTITDYHSAQVLEQAVAAKDTPPTPETESNLPAGYLSRFAALYDLNEDLAGWILIPDTNVNLPVVQAEDNSFYLNHNINREHDINGLPFLDFRNVLQPDLYSTNTLIYGHNMTSGMMFRDLIYYKDPEYYKAHPFVYFDTVYNENQWVIFSCFEANTEPHIGEVFEYFNFVNSKDPARAQWYIDQVKDRSYFDVDIDVTIEDKFLTLQTCANDAYETKVCIVARQLREGESPADFDFESAVSNPDRLRPVRYPSERS